ncbi:MAG TPA: hypothetical protein VF493_11140, partial [Terriglobales bacterium]
SQYIMVKYEELVADPSATVSRVLGRCDVEMTESVQRSMEGIRVTTPVIPEGLTIDVKERLNYAAALWGYSRR